MVATTTTAVAAVAAMVSPTTNSSFSTLRNPKPSPFFSTPSSFPPNNHKALNLTPRFKTLTPVRSSSNPSDLSHSSSSSINPLSLKSRLRSGGTLYGIRLVSFSPTVAETAGLAGYDFAVVDMEHGPGGISDALHCLHALAGTGTPKIVRLPESSPTWPRRPSASARRA
ncbi:hypothetical protein NL676_011089 [Syzygium grande]|nr:hypothetical protein NL676_011089 [Syzygium grande]